MKQPTDRDQDADNLNRRSFLNRAIVLAVCPASFSVTTREGVAAPSPCDDCTQCTSRFCRFRVVDLARETER